MESSAGLNHQRDLVTTRASRRIFKEAIMDIIKTERGWGGHFILARDCQFRRNTLLEFGEIRIVVSTVGAMLSWDFRKADAGMKGDAALSYQEIWHNRRYETMCFHAKLDGPYWDANVQRNVYFRSEWAIAEHENETDMKANNMHEAVVAEISERLLRGEEFPTE